MNASLYYNVPESLLRAIAQTESDSKPYALNIAGVAHYPSNKAEALRLMETDNSYLLEYQDGSIHSGL